MGFLLLRESALVRGSLPYAVDIAYLDRISSLMFKDNEKNMTLLWVKLTVIAAYTHPFFFHLRDERELFEKKRRRCKCRRRV